MRKRYLRLDIEYDMDEASMIFMTRDNIQRILAEDMPYCKVIFSRDTPERDRLDDMRYKGPVIP